MSNERSGGGFSVSFLDTSTTSLDSSWGISELILVGRDAWIIVCVSCFSPTLFKVRRTNLLQEQGHIDPRHTTINSDYQARENIKIFGPEMVREEMWSAILRP